MNATPDIEAPTPRFREGDRTIVPRRNTLVRQLLRFAMVGGLNTALDLLILNSLLWLFPTRETTLLLLFNSIAYITGAVNSFFFNKYWTFRDRQKTTLGELVRFSATTLAGVACNNAIIWLVSTHIHPFIANANALANVSKIIAICGTVFISFICMRLWVFVHRPREETTMKYSFFREHPDTFNAVESSLYQREELFNSRDLYKESQPLLSTHSLSVILPAHNEERIIATTVFNVFEMLSTCLSDFEIIVVNDGSTDQTGSIVASMAKRDARVRLVTHEVNQGYGAALVSGFHAATRELTFFMDADGQFDIDNLKKFLPFIDEYDAIIGYRIHRQDTRMRKLNAWGWKLVIGLFLGVYVRDIDCAFKLLHTDFLREHPLRTRGAMINAELLHKLIKSRGTYREVGVHHLPRTSGQATGAKPAVILRAFRELFTYVCSWKREELKPLQKLANMH